MGDLRQATTAIAAIGAMVAWLIVTHGLREDSRKGTERGRARPYNLSTVVTLTLGVICFYAALFALNLVAAGLVLSPGLFRSELSHQVSWTDYVALALLTTSMGTIAGALGSGLESDTAVREAAYSHRSCNAKFGGAKPIAAARTTSRPRLATSVRRSTSCAPASRRLTPARLEAKMVFMLS